MNAITNPIATRASTPVMAMPRYRPPMTSDWNLGCLPGTALLRAILHHEHTKRKTANRSLVNSNQATRGDRYGRNAALFSLDAGTETTALLERRTRAGHRSLKQGQLEVVGIGAAGHLSSAGGPARSKNGADHVMSDARHKVPLSINFSCPRARDDRANYKNRKRSFTLAGGWEGRALPHGTGRNRPLAESN